MSKHFRHSLRIKLILASIIIEIIMLSLLLFNSFRLVNELIEEQTLLRIEAINPLLEASLSIALFQQDYEILITIINQLQGEDDKGFEYIVILDPHDKIYAQTGSFTEKTLPSPEYDLKNAINERLFNGRTVLRVSGQKVGEVRYGLSIASFVAGKEKILHQSFIIANIEVFLTALLLGLTGYFLTRHLGKLLSGTEQIQQGNYDINVTINSRDEIGMLANEFNLMAQAVRTRIQELNQSKDELSKNQAQFESIFHSIADVIIFVDKEFKCIMINPMVNRMFGYHQDELLGHSIDCLYSSQSDFSHNVSTMHESNQFHKEILLKRKSGSNFQGEIFTSAVLDKNNQLTGFVSIFRDISHRIQIQDALNREREQAQITLESIGDAVITTNADGYVDYLNPIAEEMLGWSKKEARGRLLPEIFKVFNEITGQPIENPVQRCLREQKIIEISKHSKLLSRHGIEYAIEDNAAPIRDKQGKIIGVVLVFHDVSTSRRMASALSWQATHDALTGLINRQEFEIQLNQLLCDAQDNDSIHSMLYLDLDQFKVVNDTSGHIAGDELLRQLSNQFQLLIRESDTIARLGGDEFGILLKSCPLSQALRVADSFIGLLEEFRFHWEQNYYTFSVSIGVVLIDSECDSITQLMSYADIACYAAKDSGRNRIHVYQADDSELLKRQGEMQWVAQIKAALDQNDFILYAQPIVAISNHAQKPHHFEILLRLKNEQGDIIPPIAFLPAAERYHLMTDIDRWVVDSVFSYLMENPVADCIFSINLSGQSLDDEDFLDFIITRLRNTNISCQSICFEITETAAISNYNKALIFLSRLSQLGCQFSLDDFGSGLSSFGYLKNFPVDFLKIDGTFIKDMVNNPIDSAMVEAINHIGHVMNIETIAEFVENEAIQRLLEEMGIDYAQGFGIAKPMPLEQVLENEYKK